MGHSREQGHAIIPKTRAVYLPLVDMIPSKPDTMLTVMVEVQRQINSCGQEYTIFTNDQQLYRVMVGITWSHPEIFTHFIPRLGGMHTLMNFVDSVRTLMSDSGLENIIKVAFGGVQLADRHDLSTTHKEGDVVIIQQAVHLASVYLHCFGL